MAPARPLERRIAPQAWPLALCGAWIAGVAGVVSLLFASPGWGIVAGVAAVLTPLHVSFFRNPRRVPPPGESHVVAPADGRVVEVAEVEDPDGFVGRARRIAIFLSIFDVHVNRVPLSAKVRGLRSGGSAYRAAFRSAASSLNVRTRLDLETSAGVRAAVVQITGLIARRIVCHAREGDTLERGAPYGLICYGSRVELYLPAGCEVRVQRGERVRAGETIVAEISA